MGRIMGRKWVVSWVVSLFAGGIVLRGRVIRGVDRREHRREPALRVLTDRFAAVTDLFASVTGLFSSVTGLFASGTDLSASTGVNIVENLRCALEVVRTGSWTGPPRGERAPRTGISSTVFGVRGVRALIFLKESCQ